MTTGESPPSPTPAAARPASGTRGEASAKCSGSLPDEPAAESIYCPTNEVRTTTTNFRAVKRIDTQRLEELCQLAGGWSTGCGPDGPGPVEAGVEAEIEGLAQVRPGVAQMALAMAQIMDSTKAVNQRPAAGEGAGLFASTSCTRRRRSAGLELVRTTTEKGGA
jgi:hypothetical protein